MDKLERMMATISPIGGVGMGLWLSFYLERNIALVIGVFIVFISAVLLSILSYLRKKKLAKQNE